MAKDMKRLEKLFWEDIFAILTKKGVNVNCTICARNEGRWRGLDLLVGDDIIKLSCINCGGIRSHSLEILGISS